MVMRARLRRFIVCYSNMSENKRDYRLDILRVVAISMIVLMHSPKPDSVPGFVLSGLSYLTASGLVLFFVISGALLLNNRLGTWVFLRRRFSKILYPTLFWTLFYIGVNIVVGAQPTAKTIRSLLSIPFSAQGHGVLWFMYTLAGLYLLVPILSRWLQKASKREVEFYLLLWGVTLIYPYLKLWLQVNESNDGILYYFAGFVGFFVLGFYLRHHYEYRLWHVIAAIAIALAIPAVLFISGKEYDFYSVLWYLSLPVALMAFAIYVLVMRCPNKRLELVGMISKLSFGVYFIHIFLMRNIIWNLDVVNRLPGLVQIPVIALTTFLMSLFLSWLISKLPFSKYIIGV